MRARSALAGVGLLLQAANATPADTTSATASATTETTPPPVLPVASSGAQASPSILVSVTDSMTGQDGTNYGGRCTISISIASGEK